VAAAVAVHPMAPSSGADIASSVFDRLAKSIDNLTNQDTRRVHIEPEVLAKQNAARLTMGELILARRTAIQAAERAGEDADAEWPLYRVLDFVYLNDRKIEPYQRGTRGDVTPTVIQWDGVPNAYLLPMNEHAEEIFRAFANSINTTANEAGIGPTPLWMSHNGLVVRGDPPSASHSHIALNNGTNAASGQLDVRNHTSRMGIKNAIDPGAEHIHVLGTLAPPARQNYRGSDGPRPAHKLNGTV
jgi:hypothetical protein